MHTAASQEVIPTVAGTPFAGGFYVGRNNQVDGVYALIAAPRADGEHAPARWNKSLKAVAGAMSFFDGLANTKAMAKAGSTIAQWALDLRIGGEADWYIPSRDELELVYRHLKPTEEANWVWRHGDNPSSVPPGYPYGAKSPTHAVWPAFRHGGAEALEAEWYWTSTQHADASDYAWFQLFSRGLQDCYPKSNELRVRAVRRLIIR